MDPEQPPRRSRTLLTGYTLAAGGLVLIAVAIASRIWCAEHADRTLSVLIGIAGLAIVIIASALMITGAALAATRIFAHGARFGVDLTGGTETAD